MRQRGRPVRPMYEGPKATWRSKTVWAGLVPVLVEVVDWLAPSLGLPPVPDELRRLVIAAAFGGVWYGRSVAQGPLREWPR